MGMPAEKLLTIDQFLNWNDGTDRRYELVEGRVVAMAPCSQSHSQIATNLAFEIRRRLRPPCRVLGEAAVERLDRNDRFYEADVAVTCTPHRPDQRSTPEPVLIAEILSESTAQHDRGTKVPDYQEIPSVQEILLVDSRRRRVQLWRRDGTRWWVEDFSSDDAILPLTSIGAEIPLGALYEGLSL